MNKTLLALLLTALLGSMLPACGGSGGADERADKQAAAQKVLHRGNGAMPGTLDPGLAEDIHAFNILFDLYEGLTAESADGQLIPGVAESWSISADGLVYTFTLRKNARWSNGDPVLAQDFVRAFRRVAAADTASPGAFLLQPLLNFDAVLAGDLGVEALGVRALTERTLEMRLANPASHWLSLMAFPIAFPMHAKDPGAEIWNGAYVLQQRPAEGPIKLRKSDVYWDRDNVSIDQVIYYPTVDPVAEFNRYRAGELDITYGIPGERVRDARREYAGEVRIAPYLALYYLAFDLSEAPFDNKALRQSLAMAIDREQLVRLLDRGEQTAYTIVPPGVAAYQQAENSLQALSTDKRHQMAKELYAQAGYSDERPLRIRYVYNTGDTVHETLALAITAMWRDVLGVDATLEKMEWRYFLAARDDRAAWDIMRFSWSGDYNSAKTFLDIFRSDNAQNLSRFNNSGYDQLMASADQQSDAAESAALMRQAEAILVDEYPVVPVYFFVSKHMVRSTVSGFESNVMDRHPSRFMDIATP